VNQRWAQWIVMFAEPVKSRNVHRLESPVLRHRIEFQAFAVRGSRHFASRSGPVRIAPFKTPPGRAAIGFPRKSPPSISVRDTSPANPQATAFFALFAPFTVKLFGSFPDSCFQGFQRPLRMTHSGILFRRLHSVDRRERVWPERTRATAPVRTAVLRFPGRPRPARREGRRRSGG